MANFSEFGVLSVDKIPPLDLAQQYETIKAEAAQAVAEVLASGRYIGGTPVSEFEAQFAAYHQVSSCVACNSGTDALFLALKALEIGPGDEVITTPFTFIATAEAIAMVGATPVFVDIDPRTLNLDPQWIEKAIRDRTKAILPVHLFGQPADMSAINAIARAYNLYVIEDCAQATGATWGGQKCGSIGDIGCFSFFPTKNLGACGDGGAIVANNPNLAAKVRMLKEHGSRCRYYHEVTGTNSRLDAIQAAILNIKLRYLDSWNQRRRELQANYQDLLQNGCGKTMLVGKELSEAMPANQPAVILPQELSDGCGVWNQYTIRVWDGSSYSSEFRDRIRQQLQAAGVATMVYYPIPLHLQPVYQSLGYTAGCFPVAESTAKSVLSLPIFPEMTFAQQKKTVCALQDCVTDPALKRRGLGTARFP
ncbi:DegT/DnrJ/EryC1/StrS family aminotransferase [Geitlerinema sp. PCC 9228]|uniref:aminotransferase class I/II-fold pyridoxal phosphate-dependent enzyme n=1 Tax=Geitlerinema sp. PCC 9228 TaxID=111611 RepID=UPI0008F9B821